MRLLYLFIYLLCSCTQKKVYYIFPSLKEQKTTIYFELPKKYSKLKKDNEGNSIADFTKNDTLFTSNNYREIQNCRPIFCFKDSISEKCYFEEFEINKLGFKVIINSNFTSDTTKKKDYIKAAIVINIKKK